MKYIKILLTTLFLFQIGFLISCGSDEPDDIVPPPDNDVTLKEAAPYPFGAALNVSKMKSSEAYIETVKSEFNSITAENAMKMSSLSPVKDQYTWTDADYFVDFGLTNDMRIHGHCLVWHNSLPAWVNSFSGTKDDWKNLLRNYITTVVTHYKGKVASWDVVNEALQDNGTPRQSIWYTKIGWEYVALSFQYAHEADPDVVLFYNDYGQEYSSVKLAAINDTVMNMVRRGVPIHGIGLQMHTNISQSTENMLTAIKKTAETGLLVHVSELDVALNKDKNAGYVLNTADLNTQKSRYRFIAAAMRLVPDAQNWGITTWGVGDTDSWLKDSPDYPLIFDKDYNRKVCYSGILEAFSADLKK